MECFDLPTTNAIAVIEDNLFSSIAAFRSWPRAEVHDEGDIKWSITDIPFPLFNSIFCAQLAPNRVDAAIQSIIAKARLRNVPLLWWTGPSTQPADLGQHLKRHGFNHAGQVLGMAVDLVKLNEKPSLPAGLTIQQAVNSEALKQWSQVCAIGFGMPDWVADAYYDLMRYVDPDTVLAYLGRLNGEPVAASVMVVAGGAAGIYNAVTVPEARRKGIGAVMIRFPLQEARERGYRTGIGHASKMSIKLARSLGFQEYCRIGQYVWP